MGGGYRHAGFLAATPSCIACLSLFSYAFRDNAVSYYRCCCRMADEQGPVTIIKADALDMPYLEFLPVLKASMVTAWHKPKVGDAPCCPPPYPPLPCCCCR